MTITKLIKSFKKLHPEINEQELMALLNVDPTIVDNEQGLFCGKYAVWISNQYVDGNIKPGDAPELKAALTTYDKNKSHLKPIKEAKGLTELIDLVKDLSDDFKPSRCISKGEQGLEKVYEDDEWIVYIPHTFEASRKIGGDTRWCTAASNGQDRFDYYAKQGPLYVNIRKSDGEKFQFHFETNQFMDKEDKGIKLKGFGFNESIIKFYTDICQHFKLYLLYDRIIDNVEYNFSDDLICICNDNKWSFSHKNGLLFANDKWFESTDIIREGWAPVSFDKSMFHKCQNYVNEYGEFLLKENCEECYAFQNGFGIVRSRINGKNKFNYIDKQGNLLMKDFVDNVNTFTPLHIAIIMQDNMNIIINEKGEYVSKPFPHIYWGDNSDVGIVSNRYMNQFNLISKDGNILSETWFDYITDFYKFFMVKKNNKYTIVDNNLKPVINFWFDDYRSLMNNDCMLILNGKMKYANVSYPNLFIYDLTLNNDLLCQ